ncbi:DUF669 domain-containing protein [Amorphus sp. MBR-141]
MGHLGFTFNSNEVAPDDGSGGGGIVVPDGAYLFQLVESEVKANAKSTGTIMKYRAEFLDGDYQGSSLTGSINVTHTNPVAQKIGQGELSALCHATGKLEIEDSEELHYEPFWAETVVEKYKDRDGNDREKSVIKRFLFEEENAAPPEEKQEASPPANAAAQAAAAAQASAARKPPARPSSPPSKPAAAGGRNVPWKR